MTIALLALLLATDARVALRVDARPVTEAQAKAMTPAALADALLDPGHPPIVETELPDPMASLPPPPPYIPPLNVGLVAAATWDRASGFCLKHRWHVTGTAAGVAQAIAPEPTLYRLPPPSGGCEAPRFMSFFAVAPEDRPRAFTIVRLLADAAVRPDRFGGVVSVESDDAARSFPSLDKAEERSLLVSLPLDRIFVVRRYIVTPLFDHRDLAGADGRPRENWEIYAADPHGGRVWSIHLALDGDRIVALRALHAIPAPF